MREIPLSQNAYISNTPDRRGQMLDAVGATSIDDLFDIPREIMNPIIQLPPPLSELELIREMQALAEKNSAKPSFTGFGVYHRFQPAIVPAVIGRDEFRTAYTPYQPEGAQGTTQTAYENQSLMCDLYGMDVSNTGLYDGATALGEAALMSVRVQSDVLREPDRRRIVALNTIHPNWLEVLSTYIGGKEIALDIVDRREIEERLGDAAALLVQSPNMLGGIEDLEELAERAHQGGALLVAASDPVSLGLLKPPGECGADIAVGEGQSLGNPRHLGGVNTGIFTVSDKYILQRLPNDKLASDKLTRKMPGRIVGATVDAQGRRGYALTLQNREQHIARWKATSNICTAEQLVALSATIYMAALGPRGLRRIAELNYHNAHYLADQEGKC